MLRVDWPSVEFPNPAQRRTVCNALAAAYPKHLLCYLSSDGQRASFVWARPHGTQIELRTLPYEPGTTAWITVERLAELALAPEELGSGEPPASVIADRLSRAFDVEALRRRFFSEYVTVFAAVESSVRGVPDGNARRLYTQRLFNRLLFFYFLQCKGWGSFAGSKNDLRTLFIKATDAQRSERRGEVPLLNGGLFDVEDEYDQRDKVKVPQASFAAIFELFECYNFTVAEATPLDREVAVDSEMLGKVFEELVTGRRQTGSYYTPRPIVSFMCRVALKHFLRPVVSDETAISRFVDDGDSAQLSDPGAVLGALTRVKVCDPACGSGAYLLGMMQELLRLREALFITHGLDSQTAYERKLAIIERNLHGTDLDPFAVNIAKLRLWLSLAVDSEGAMLPGLPNLDFNIACGDSLTGPNPQEMPVLCRACETENADPPQPTPVDWRRAFAEVFRNGGFDIVLANPPYGLLNKRQNQKVGPCLVPQAVRQIKASAEYRPILRGMVNVCALFIRRSFSLLRSKGIFVELIPLAFAGDRSYGPLRRYIFENHTVQSLDAFPERDDPRKRVFAGAKMSVCILAARCGTEGEQAAFSLRLNHQPILAVDSPAAPICPRDLRHLNADYSVPLVTQADFDVLGTIYNHSIRLREIGRCHTGEVDLTQCRPYIRTNERHAPMHKGAMIDRYRIRERMSQGQIEYVHRAAFLKARGGNGGSSAWHHTKRRIVLQGITGVNEKSRLKMTLLAPGTFLANSANYILLNDPATEDDYLFTLAVLNSQTANFVFQCFSTNSNVNGYEVDNLPLPRAAARDKHRLAALARTCLKLHAVGTQTERAAQEIAKVEREIDERVATLYGLLDLPRLNQSDALNPLPIASLLL